MTTTESLRQLIARGKVLRKPTIGEYDNRDYVERPSVVVTDTSNNHLYADADRTHSRDKALLVALGVDGDVPLAQARVNAGLDEDPSNLTLEQFAARVSKMPRTANLMRHAPMGADGGMEVPAEYVPAVLSLIGANDNHEIAARAA